MVTSAEPTVNNLYRAQKEKQTGFWPWSKSTVNYYYRVCRVEKGWVWLRRTDTPIPRVLRLDEWYEENEFELVEEGNDA